MGNSEWDKFVCKITNRWCYRWEYRKQEFKNIITSDPIIIRVYDSEWCLLEDSKKLEIY